MKLIEALKKIKELQKKADDIRSKIRDHSAYLDMDNPVYPDQAGQVKEWLQAHSDLLKEIMRLRIAIQKTNLETPVTIELGGKNVVKSIAEWIHRRRDLAGYECQAWKCLTDRNLRDGQWKQSTGEIKDVKIVRCFAPKERDEKIALFDSEPSIIDAKLEVVNAVTDLIEEEKGK